MDLSLYSIVWDILYEQGRHWGGHGGGVFAPPEFEKCDLFVILPTKCCFFHIFPPPRKSVKILPPPLEKTEITSLFIKLQ